MRPSLFLLLVASPVLAGGMCWPSHLAAAEKFAGAPATALSRPAQAQSLRLAQAQMPILAEPRSVSQLLGAAQSLDLTGFPGKPIQLIFTQAPPAARDARFIMIRGVPDGFLMSVGFRVKRSWFISLDDAKDLHMTPPGNFTGDLVLEVFYFKDSRDPPLASLVRTVAIRPEDTRKPAPTPSQTDIVGAAANMREAAPLIRKVQLTAEKEVQMLIRGDEFLKHGDIAAARLMFEDLASLGSAKGAFAMAQSYDPAALRKLFIQGGLQPDIALAKTWYQNAARLGSSDADSVLSALEGGVR